MTSPIMISAAAISLLIWTPETQTEDKNNASSDITADDMPFALHDADAGALTSSSALDAGSGAFAAVHQGAVYHFASAETLAAFEADPTRYVLQFGGCCAYSVGLGKKSDGNTRFADVVDGKLYLFVDAAVFAEYQKDIEGTIAKAAATWPTLQSAPVSRL